MSVGELTTIAILIAFMAGLATQFVSKQIVFWFRYIKWNIKNNKEFNKKKKEVEDMKANGDMHEWINLPTMQGNKLVCKKTGWCPELEGFIPMHFIQRHLMNVEIQKQTEEKYEKFKESKIKEVSDQYNLDESLIHGIMDKAFEIKKEFHTKLIEEQQADMEKQIEETRRRIADKT